MFRDQEEAFKATRESAKKATEHAASALSFAKRLRPHGLSEWYLPNDNSISMLSVLFESAQVAKLVKAVTPTRAANMPASRLNELNGTISALASALESFVSMGDQVEKDNRPLKYFKDGRVEGSLTGEQYYNFGDIASDIYHRIDAVRNTPALIGIVSYDLKSEERYEQSVSEVTRRALSSAAELSALVSTASDQVDIINLHLEKAEEEKAALSASWEEKQNTLNVISNELDAAKSDAETARDAVSEAKMGAEAIQSGLKVSVSEAEKHLEDIGSFHTKLVTIRSELEDLRDRADAGDEKQQEYVKKIADLIADAEAMVSGATTAGLAKAFDDERVRLSNAMGWAMFSFLIGIAFLFVTTILLAAYVFEIPIEIFGYNVGQSGVTPKRGDEITLAGVLSRTVILLAPFWLTLFSSRRYRNLFDLRQQYTHKYSMAFSVDGFKKQAPLYAEQMAAWVFQVVSEPPVSIRSSKGMGDNPLPDVQAVVRDQLEKFGKLIPNRTAE